MTELDTEFLNACYDGHLNKLKELLPLISTIHLVDRENNTPLWYAVIQEHFDIIDFLVGNGANINEFDEEGNNILDGINNVNLLNQVIRYGFNVHQFEEKKESPLYYLICYGHIDVATRLIELGVKYQHLDFYHGRFSIEPSYIKEIEDFIAVFNEKTSLEKELNAEEKSHEKKIKI